MIETIVDAAGWARALPEADALAASALRAAAAREGALGGEVALLLADDAALKALNARFRGRDEPTNVLSFPSGGTAPEFLGDVALGYETCAREAAEKGVALADHAAHLIVHGLLHLVGHDHASEPEARAMEALEAEILGAMGLGDPYADDMAAKPQDGGA